MKGVYLGYKNDFKLKELCDGEKKINTLKKPNVFPVSNRHTPAQFQKIKEKTNFETFC